MCHIELLGELGVLYLIGLSPYQISKKIHLAVNVIKSREKAILLLMQIDYPALYDWWINHYLYRDKAVTLVVKQQKEQFIGWLTHLLRPPKQDPCPVCGKSNNICFSNGLPIMYCHNCRKTHRLISLTVLRNTNKSELWHDYAELLMLGATNREIAQSMDICTNVSSAWRKKFLKQMTLLGLHELVHWIVWQRNRNHIKNVVEVSRKIHKRTKR